MIQDTSRNKGAWLVGGGVIIASALLGFWFLPERGRADIVFAQEYPWLKEDGIDAIIEAGHELPDFELIRNLERIEVLND